MEQHANSSDGASDPTNPSTSQLRRSGYIIGVIALVIVILTAATRPLSNTQWWLIFVAFVILISVAAIVLHRYEMIEYRAKELKIKMHLDVQFLAQGQILEQLRQANTRLWGLVQLVGGPDLEEDELPPFETHHQAQGAALVDLQVAMVWELQLTYRIKKALLTALNGEDKKIPNLTRFIDDRNLEPQEREKHAQIAIAKVLGQINGIDAKILTTAAVQQLQVNSHK